MFPDLKSTEVKEVASYLQEGIHAVKVDEVKSSNTIEGYTGTPFVEFKVSNEKGTQTLRFQGTDSTTSAIAARVRTEIFKGFLVNAGAKSFDNLAVACKEAVGSSIKVCLSSREYWNNDKVTGAPILRKSIDYKFSGKSTKELVMKDSYNKSLSSEDLLAFKAANEAHIMAMSGETTQAGHPADNTPF